MKYKIHVFLIAVLNDWLSNYVMYSVRIMENDIHIYNFKTILVPLEGQYLDFNGRRLKVTKVMYVVPGRNVRVYVQV